MSADCKARQYSDQMMCACGLAWDVNDIDPPECQGMGKFNSPIVAAHSIVDIVSTVNTDTMVGQVAMKTVADILESLK